MYVSKYPYQTAKAIEDLPENESTNEAKIQKWKRRCERFKMFNNFLLFISHQV